MIEKINSRGKKRRANNPIYNVFLDAPERNYLRPVDGQAALFLGWTRDV